MGIRLRTLADSDLDTLFVWESDPVAVEMAAFTRANPSNRSEFDAHYERIRNDPSCTLRAIVDDGEFVGTVGSFTMEGEREVTYWIAPSRWGRGLASRALQAFLAIEQTRPIYGRVAEHNAASAKVLARAGFIQVGSDTAFARGVGAEIVEHIYRLDPLGAPPVAWADADESRAAERSNPRIKSDVRPGKAAEKGVTRWPGI